MTPFLHVLLLLALCVFGNQALNNQTGCPHGNGNAQYNINEKLPIGTEVILFENIKNITLSGTAFDVTKKGDEAYAVILKKNYVYDASNIGNNLKNVHFTCVPKHGSTIQMAKNAKYVQYYWMRKGERRRVKMAEIMAY
ncbi:uncharacterized protein LOC117337833 [Pecten maximus]|uniref:uncharacterized protein LOC117337833 n=1 Tax=Pecten maximus TaxID=6579 RepID=UPI0014582410|nr:uncharacterized protein LOC117337833 [Pecten maximus]